MMRLATAIVQIKNEAIEEEWKKERRQPPNL
jgi:hypothetical protein